MIPVSGRTGPAAARAGGVCWWGPLCCGLVCLLALLALVLAATLLHALTPGRGVPR